MLFLPHWQQLIAQLSLAVNIPDVPYIDRYPLGNEFMFFVTVNMLMW